MLLHHAALEKKDVALEDVLVLLHHAVLEEKDVASEIVLQHASQEGVISLDAA